MNILIQHGRVIDPANHIDAQHDLYIADGKIVAIDQAPSGFKANQTIDASGLVVAPGLVDLSVRLREPGFEYKATLNSELQAAAAGGVTSLACPPDTEPTLDEPGLVEMLKYRAKKLNLAHVYPLGALTRQLEGKTLTEMCELTEAGCVGFTQADHPIIDTQVLWRACEYAATFGYTLFLRAEDPYLAKDGVAHDGEVASRLGLKGIPAAAESLALASLLRIARETGTRLHIQRLSTAEGVALVRQAKQQGQAVTADVSTQHLHLTELDIGFFNTQTHLRPPLRTQRDQYALCEGLKDGTIDAICSDHSPVDDDAKLLPFAEAETGASAVELLLPLTLKWASNTQQTLSDAIARITIMPATIMGITAGSLTVGQCADVVIFNPDEYRKVEAQHLKSQGKNTPFLNMELAGKVHYTLVEGLITYSTL
ncbi:dihydroorotase [Methylotenera sp. 1P/1]|uniref:dihydroorotase n=1 Tax=Methylotenera sp. 1P/1 TaxID=1131551 RepID=UPI0003718D4A|nr:dihydroorotase [Methylotenera sp. 1P/1]